MLYYNRYLSSFSALILTIIALKATTSITKTAFALPEKDFWNNDWQSDLEPIGNAAKLEGTVLFAQSQTIPSKHGIENDSQPHLTALRKALVMLRPHTIDDEEVDIALTVKDANGKIVSGNTPIKMEDPENIPKQDGWIELGKVEGDIEIPFSLDDPYVVEGQSNLNSIVGSATENDNLVNIFNNQKKEVEVKTQNGSWVKEIYLPDGSQVLEGSKFQITCKSTWGVKIHYPKERKSSTLRTKDLSTNEKQVLVMISDVWVAIGDEKPMYHPRIPSSLSASRHVVSGRSNIDKVANDPESVGLTDLLNNKSNEIEIKTRNGAWARDFYLPKSSGVPKNSKIQVTCNSGWGISVHYPNEATGGWKTRRLSNGDVSIIVLDPNKNMWLASDDLEHNEYVFGHNFYTAILDRDWVKPGMTLEFAASTGQRGSIEADVGGVTELTITALDAGFLTEPRDEFTFKDDPTTNTEYFETTMASRLVVVQYETMHFTEIMMPTGKLYDHVSDDDGGVHSGDMRQFIGKFLLSHGIDLANYGISSSKGQSEKPHPFTCAFLAAHNTVGMYQNGRVKHGLSGGNGMITLLNSIGNEMSHEVGHNYGLGHYVGGFDGSVHRPANQINSAWGWDSGTNTFRTNFAASNSGKEQCIEDDCQSPFMGKFQFGKDAMAGGEPMSGSNRFTLYTPLVSKTIQEFLESKAMWDETSSTGFRKYDSASGKMKEFLNYDNGGKKPRLYRVPVTTIVGYYEPDLSRSLQSYIYPALHGAYGFVYNDDGGSSSGTPDGCELVVRTSTGSLVFSLDTAVDNKGMNKFHVNVATEDDPHEASLYCRGELLAIRALDAPRAPLKYTVNGLPFSDSNGAPTDAPTDALTGAPTNVPTSAPISAPTDAPTNIATKPPTKAPTNATKPPTKAPTNIATKPPTKAPTNAGNGTKCKDKHMQFGKHKRDCSWVGKGSRNYIRRKCRFKHKKKRIWARCLETCGKVGIGRCKHLKS